MWFVVRLLVLQCQICVIPLTSLVISGQNQDIKRQGLQGFPLDAMYIGNSEKNENSNIHIYGGSIPK